MENDRKGVYTEKNGNSHWKAILISLLIANIALLPFVLDTLLLIPVTLLPSVFTASQFAVFLIADVISVIAYTLLPFINLAALSFYITRRHPGGKAKVASYAVLTLLVTYISYHIYVDRLWGIYIFASPVPAQGWATSAIEVVFSIIIYVLVPLIALFGLSFYITRRHPEGKAKAGNFAVVILLISWILSGTLIVEPNPTIQSLSHKYIARDYDIWIKKYNPAHTRSSMPTPTPSIPEARQLASPTYLVPTTDLPPR